MANTTIHITGMTDTLKRVKRIGGSFQASLLKGANYLRGKFAIYPPQRPGATYRRTYNLKRRWAVAPETDTRVRIANNVPYARHVMDEDVQPYFMRRLGWRPVQEISKAERARLVGIVRTDLLAQVKRQWKRN